MKRLQDKIAIVTGAATGNGLAIAQAFAREGASVVIADVATEMAKGAADSIKTSGGKFIAPQPIENSLKLNPLVGVAAILGDRRKFAAVIVSPNFAALEEWASENNIAFASRAELVAHPKVQALYEGIVEAVNGNLARFEKLKRVMIVADEFTPDNGALTPTMKLKRKVIEERYRKQIDELYAQAEVTTMP